MRSVRQDVLLPTIRPAGPAVKEDYHGGDVIAHLQS